MKHSFAPNTDLEICPPLRRSQNCRWGRQTQPGKSVAISKEQRANSDPSLNMIQFPVSDRLLLHPNNPLMSYGEKLKKIEHKIGLNIVH